MHEPVVNTVHSTAISFNQVNSTTRMSYYMFILLSIVLIGRPQEIIPFLEKVRPVLLLTIINVVLVIVQNKNLISRLNSSSIGKKYLLFYGMMIIGIPFAYYRRMAFDFIFFQYIINMLYFSLLVVHTNTYERLKGFVSIITLSMLFYGLACLLMGVSSEDRLSFGSTYDPNDLAYLLVSLLPFAIIVIAEVGNVLLKLLASVSIITSLYIVLLTGSRGGLLGLVCLLILLLFPRFIRIDTKYKIMMLMVILVFGIVEKDKIFTDRFATILNLSQDYNATDEEGRIKLWEKGLAFTISRPLTGVGAQCFPMAIGLERKQRHVQEKWQVVHNSYIQISSELGVIAFIIFFLMLKESNQVLSKMTKINDDTIQYKQLQSIAGITQIGFICHLIVAFFLTQGYSILFTLFFAMSTSLTSLSNDLLQSAGAHESF